MLAAPRYAGLRTYVESDRGMSEDQVYCSVAQTVWEVSTPATRHMIQQGAKQRGHLSAIEFIISYLREERKEFDTLEDWLDTLPGRVN